MARAYYTGVIKIKLIIFFFFKKKIIDFCDFEVIKKKVVRKRMFPFVVSKLSNDGNF